jgi:OOP family OmpA-OmpF porin
MIMKKAIFLLVFFSALLVLPSEVNAQVRINLKDKLNREVNRRANRRADKAIDASLDKIEEGIEGDQTDNNNGNKDGISENEAANNETKDNQNQQAGNPVTANAEPAPSITWSKYDFVPGDAVIFEDDQAKEENGEFPSRWDLIRGNVEIAEFNGEKVIMLRDGTPAIVPYLNNPKQDYLPDVFTIELDLYYPGGGTFEIHLYDRKNQESGSPTGYTSVDVNYDRLTMGQAVSKYPGENLKKARWMHIAIAYTDGKLKAYMDDTRLINIPHLDFNPKGLTLYTYHAHNDNIYYVKNIRIAKGGVKYYDRIMQDGKIIVNGIRFDVNKSTIKPESMGAINEIYNLMKENPDLKFSVEGHTDSQGDDAFNMKLSQERAEAVMNTLVKMGISADRLTAKGWGESKPISNNASPEDMANNRRVEFVKI